MIIIDYVDYIERLYSSGTYSGPRYQLKRLTGQDKTRDQSIIVPISTSDLYNLQ